MYNSSLEKDFPIGLEYLICDGKKIMFMYVKTDADILSDLLNKGLAIFNDEKDEIDLKKIDFIFEYSGEDKHVKYITGLDFEHNCINQLLSNIKNNIIVLPNIIFYIEEKFHQNLANVLKLTPKVEIKLQETTKPLKISYIARQFIETPEKKYTGFNELDFVIKVEKDFLFNVQNFTLVNIIQNGNNKKLPEKLEFKKNMIYIFEFKVNSFYLDNSIVIKTYNKAVILLNSLFQENQSKDFITIFAMNHTKEYTKSFIKKLDNKNLGIIYGFHVDIAVKFSNMLNLNIKVNQLQDEIIKQQKEIDSLIEENKNQFQELLEKIEKLENNNSK